MRLRGALPWLERAATWGVAAWCGYFVLKYLWIAVMTIDFPYQMEWMEGGVVETVARLIDGQAIYPAPSLDYVGYIYPPFYFAVSALFSTVMGVDFLALRLVSLLSILGFAALLCRMIWRETAPPETGASGRSDRWRRHRWALVGVGLFFATYDLSGRWLHLVRVDSLLLLLTFASLYVLRYKEGTRWAVVAGVLMAMAVLTKQTAVVTLLPVGLVVLATDWRKAVVAGAVGAIVAAAAATSPQSLNA